MPDFYHGILLDAAFDNPDKVESHFKVLRSKIDGSWKIYMVSVSAESLESTIEMLQQSMRSSAPFYLHLYNNEEIIIIFKEKFFRITADKSMFNEVVKYGKSLGIPSEQLNFFPTKFSDEDEYFS